MANAKRRQFLQVKVTGEVLVPVEDKSAKGIAKSIAEAEEARAALVEQAGRMAPADCKLEISEPQMITRRVEPAEPPAAVSEPAGEPELEASPEPIRGVA